MIYVFWLSAAFLAYLFAGYPLLVWLLYRFRPQPHQRGNYRPRVSVIVAVHNGAGVITRKLENTLALTYPRDLLEIIVAADGCTDGTLELVERFAEKSVRLVNVAEHRGKHYVQMVARDAALGDVLIFTDSGVSLPAGAIETIVANFADPRVGAVSSEDRVESKSGGETTYVGLEMVLRRMESCVNSLVGVSGSFFAARREVCARWNPDQSSDFFIALNAVRLGLRAVVDSNSYAVFGTVSKNRAEFRRKIRTIVHGLDVLFANVALLNPFRYGLFAWQLASHKLCRWLLPFAFLILLVANAFLWNAGVLYRLTLVAQLSLYGSGVVSLLISRLIEWNPLKLAGFFLVANVATILAWLNFCAGEKFVTWEPSRRA